MDGRGLMTDMEASHLGMQELIVILAVIALLFFYFFWRF